MLGVPTRVVEARSLKTLHTLPESVVLLSPDGKKLLVSSDGVLRVLGAAEGKEVSVLAGSHASVSRLSFSPDSRLLLVVDNFKTMGLFDVASGRLLRQWGVDEEAGSIRGAEFSADGSSIVVVSGERTVRRFPCHECRPIDQLIKDARRRIGRDLSPEERRSVGLPRLAPRSSETLTSFTAGS